MKHLEEVIINYDKKLMKAEQEIERLQRQKEELQVNGLRQETLFKLEIERLNNIIKEVREYIENNNIYSNKKIDDILEILDKEKDNG